MPQSPLGPVNIDKGSVLTLIAASGANSPINGQDIVNPFADGAVFGVNITAINGTVTLHIQGKDVASGQYYDILVSAALNSTGFTPLFVMPGGPTSANTQTPLPLPRTFRVQAVLSGAGNTVSLTVGASLIV